MARKSISNKSCFLPPWFNERIRYQPTQNPPGDFLRGFFLVCTLWAGHIRNELAKKVDCRKPVPTGVAQFVQSSPINGPFCPKKSTAVNQLLRESQNLSAPPRAIFSSKRNIWPAQPHPPSYTSATTSTELHQRSHFHRNKPAAASTAATVHTPGYDS